MLFWKISITCQPPKQLFFFEIRYHNVTSGWPSTHSVDQAWFPTHRSQRSSWVCLRNTGTKEVCHHAGLQNKI